ncbi:MAG: AAA family ATPase [bacterium]|nr:AAA family ATPase [bacterium]
MKILELEIDGYRSLKHVTWRPGDLNVLIGPNCAGKSNLLRVIELLSISAQGGLGKHIQAAGGMEPLVWDGQADRIQCKVRTSALPEVPNAPSVRGHVSPREFLEVAGDMTYVLSLGRLGQSSAFRVDDESLLAMKAAKEGSSLITFKYMERRALQASVYNDSKDRTRLLSTLDLEGELSEEETLLSVAGGPLAVNKQIPRYRKELARWCVYHDLHVNSDAPIRSPAVAGVDKSVSPDGQNLVRVLHTLYTNDPDFEAEVNAAMRAAFGSDFDKLAFPPAADQRIQLGVRWKSLRRTHSAADLSDGALRFLFLITVLANPSPPPVIAIDEPEAGLHPSMLPIVAEFAVDASTRSQVILTTHSPQLLDAFRDTAPTTTVTTWENGETHLKVLEDEALREWIAAYSLGELFSAGDLEAMA